MALSLFVAIEGIDGSGKTIQVKKLVDKLKGYDYNTISIKLPDYDSKSSELVKMYLNGYFGTNVQEVNPYISSIAYIADRIANFEKWKDQYYYKKNIIISDRWSWSNLAYQMAKFKNKEDKEEFIDYNMNLEYGRLGLPQPDMTIFLDMKPALADLLIKERCEKKDIHEDNSEYLNKVYKEYKYLAKKFNWEIVKCYKGNETRLIEDIHKDIFKKVESLIINVTKLYPYSSYKE